MVGTYLFQYVQFWIQLAVVSYRGKKVRTVVSPAVRSVNKARDTRNCVQNEPEYAICILLTTHIYYKTLGIILGALIWQIRHNYNRLDDGHCDITGYRKMSTLGTAGAMVTIHEIYLMMWAFMGPKLFSVVKNLLEMKRNDGFHIIVLFVYKLNLISNLSRIPDWSVHSGSYFFHSTGTFAVSTDSPLHR